MEHTQTWIEAYGEEYYEFLQDAAELAMLEEREEIE